MVIIWKPTVCTIDALNLAHIAVRAIWYMDNNYVHMRVELFESAQSLYDWQIAYPTTSQGLIVIIWNYQSWTLSSKNYLVHEFMGRFIEAYCLYYSYTQSWTNSCSGYRVDGSRADCHYTEAYGLYYWNIQTYTHNSEGYLLHGPYFNLYACWNMRKCTDFISRLPRPMLVEG